QYGNRAIPRRSFSFPRSVEPSSDGTLIVADTANNRVVELVDGRAQACPFEDDKPLFWPRCARRSRSGTTLIADGRNGRIVEASRAGKVLRQLAGLRLKDCPRLKDPHDV